MSTFLNDRYEDSQAVSLLAKDQYLRQVRWSELLTDEEEVQIFQLLFRAKCEPGNAWLAMRAKHARERLVEGYQPLVISIARRYATRLHVMEFLDLVQEGNIGLLKAIDRNEVLDKPFGGFATLCISDALFVALHDDATIHLPKSVRVQLKAMRKVERSLACTFGREPFSREVADEMGIREVEVLDLRRCHSRCHAESLQGLLQEDQDEDRYDFRPLFRAAESLESERTLLLQGRVQAALEQLTPRQREVARARYGFDGETPIRKTPRDAQRGCSKLAA